jgi:hypothetical protein
MTGGVCTQNDVQNGGGGGGGAQYPTLRNLLSANITVHAVPTVVIMVRYLPSYKLRNGNFKTDKSVSIEKKTKYDKLGGGDRQSGQLASEGGVEIGYPFSNLLRRYIWH